MLRVQWEILSSEFITRWTPKKPDLFGTKQGLCDKTPVCKNGPKIQGFNKAISIYKWDAFLHAGKKKRWSDGGGPYLYLCFWVHFIGT